jgi:uncharacterized protein YuzE
MKEPYLEVTFRHGRAMAAYLYLPRDPEEKSARTKRVEPGLIIDFTASGKPIGIEITAPGQISLAVINRILEELGRSPVTQADLAPLLAA